MKFDFTNQIKQKTDEELTEVFINTKNYNPDFVMLAEQELIARNISLDKSKQVKEEIQEINDKQLEQGKPGSSLYIFICFVLALFGGFISIYAGYIYSQSKIKNNENKDFYVYNTQTRQLGKIMMGIGVIVLLYFLLKFSFGF